MEEGKRKMIVIWGGVAAVILIGGGLAAFFALRSVKLPAPPIPPAPRNIAPVPAQGGSASGGNIAPPAPVPEPEPESEPAPAADKDTDEDGLTDAEELLLGTDIGLADSDGDSYSDAQELANLYNPAGVAPQRLLDAGLVYAYEHPTQGWSIYLPRQWSVAATDQEQTELVVTTQTTEEVFIHLATTALLGLCEGLDRVAVQAKSGASGCRERAPTTIGEEGARIAAEFSSIADGGVLRFEHRFIVPPRYPHLFDMVLQSFAGPLRGGPIE